MRTRSINRGSHKEDISLKWHIFFVTSFILFAFQTATAQKDTLRLRVMSYNVENLFDTLDDTLKNDEEFLQQATRHWNKTKYKKKLNDIARVITAVGGWEPPALVALCEVENETTMTDLTVHSSLRNAGYRYIMTDSPDKRGIDVALLYQRGFFKPETVEEIRISKFSKAHDATRDILHVEGRLLNKSTLDVFVCHLPSRTGGQKESEPFRLHVARTLKNAVDSIIKIRDLPQILIMGDFNDYPNNKSITEVLEAGNTNDKYFADNKLYHLFSAKAKNRKNYGSYKYQSLWGFLDHIIVNGALLKDNATFKVIPDNADVFISDFIMEEDKKYGGRKPFRTYNGMKYNGGYSDHLPIFADFSLIY